MLGKVNIVKLIYKKEMREGRFFIFPILFGLYFFSIHMKTFAFLYIIIFLIPTKLLNIVWSYKEEIFFYLSCGKKGMIKMAILNNSILFLEQNIILLFAILLEALFYGFDIFYLEIFLILNSFVLSYKAISYQLFFLNGALIINHQLLFVLKMIILLFSAFVIMIPYAFTSSFYLSLLFFFLGCLAYKISFYFFKQNISINKILKYVGD